MLKAKTHHWNGVFTDVTVTSLIAKFLQQTDWLFLTIYNKHSFSYLHWSFCAVWLTWLKVMQENRRGCFFLNTVYTVSQSNHGLCGTKMEAVVNANTQSDGNWQISTPCGFKTPEQILLKPRHANPRGIPTLSAVSANSWCHIFWFLMRELCSRGICHGPVSVCVSVTSQCSTKKAKHRMMQQCCMIALGL